MRVTYRLRMHPRGGATLYISVNGQGVGVVGVRDGELALLDAIIGALVEHLGAKEIKRGVP